jgi:YVTN family beta-propeller protein
MRRILFGAVVATIAIVLGGAPSRAQNAYITNYGNGSVSVIATSSNTVTATIPVGSGPYGVAVTPDGSTVYVANDNVSVIATASDTVTAIIPVGTVPVGLAVTPDGGKVYVANSDLSSNNVSVVATPSNTVTATIPVGSNPNGAAVTPDGSKVYIANESSNNVSVIATSSNTVTATIPVGSAPVAFGVFIQPAEPPVIFAGAPGNSVCHGQSVAALATEFGDVNAAAEALGFSSVRSLQNAIWAFCRIP